MKDPADFYAINMAGLPEGLIESELFGHSKGSFTGATIDYPGLLRSAGDGTVFLDEIGEAPMSLQAKLLRALQADANGKRYVRAVGSANNIPINCRIIAATKQNLFEAVQAGNFREDLYGRLMTFEVTLTALSERPADKLPILHSLGCEDLSDLDTPYWTQRIELFNVRALQAYARRKQVEV
jgi:transcriptional regulator with PAS, ATPase and Fis domain